MQRHLHHRKADAYPVRAHGDGGSKHHRISVRHGTVEMMFGQPHRIHPDDLGQFDLTQGLAMTRWSCVGSLLRENTKVPKRMACS